MKEIMETVQKQIKEEIRDARQEIDEFRTEVNDIKNVTIEMKRNGRCQVIEVSDMILFGNMHKPKSQIISIYNPAFHILVSGKLEGLSLLLPSIEWAIHQK